MPQASEKRCHGDLRDVIGGRPRWHWFGYLRVASVGEQAQAVNNYSRASLQFIQQQKKPGLNRENKLPLFNI
jgi:hypothetical protein